MPDRKKMMLYPVNEAKPLLKNDTMMVKGLKAHIVEAPPFERTIGPKMTDVHFHGLPKKIQTVEIERKLHDRFEVLSQGSRPGTFWGYSNITTGVRIIKVKKEDAKRIPAFFYVMGFKIRSWYRECERDRKCPRCNIVGHGPWECNAMKPMDPTQPKSYAEVAAGVSNNTGPERSQAQPPIPEERWKDILTPCKTPRKLEINFINHNPFDALNDEETQKENELLKEMEATEPRGTSTPIKAKQERQKRGKQ
ncbi:hypothetical protein ACJMK2_031347 [Sinanodonta woodiana]|uniref:Uncharacterized protein n=1 Tax=Sinanodonta woodiana TaxID=1069815 RepID=A0ABD3X0K1_SINWO